MKKLGFGFMRLPQLHADDYAAVDIEATKNMVDIFMENGFTYFDMAAPYHRGNSEIAFREAVVKRYPRTAYTITDKLSLFMIEKAEDMPVFFENQLERLGLADIDYYWLHGLGQSTYQKAEDFQAFAFVKALKLQGKVKHIGLSYHDNAELLDKLLIEHPEMEYVQLQLNYLDWEDTTVEARKCYEVALKHHKPVIVMEPVKGGSLASVPEEANKLFQEIHPKASAASWAIRFAASWDNVMMVLSGMSHIDQVMDNVRYMKEFQPLQEKELNTIWKAAAIIKQSIAIPCTGCRYCVDDCPKQLAIPDYFSIYNNLKRFGARQSMVASTYYGNLIRTHGKASDCLLCGRCEQHCPQHLQIRKYLQDVAEALEV